VESRGWDRRIVDKKIECREAGREINGPDSPVFLHDLSAGGCMVEFAGGAPTIGSRIELELCREQRASGEVVWQVAGCAGVRFLAPVHDAVVRHLGFQPPASEDLPRDHFGRLLPPIDAGERRFGRRH
jgi:hypothetical protein